MDFDEVALALMGPLVNWYVKRHRGLLERMLQNARMYVAPERYVARVLFATFMSAVAMTPIGAYLTFIFAESLINANGGSFTRDVLGLSFGLILAVMPIIIYFAMLNIPKIQASDLQFNIDSELPFFTAYLAMISQSGLSISHAIERIANIRLLKTIGRLAREVVVKSRAMGMDPLTALSETALASPSRLFQNIIMGYVTNIRTGGDILHYLETRLNEIVNDTLDKIRRGAEFLSMLMESYIGAGVILLIGLDVLYLAQAITPSGSVSALYQAVNNNFLFGLLVLPAISIAFLYLGEVSVYRVPFTDNRPYIAAGLSAIASAIAIVAGYLSIFGGDLGRDISIGPLNFSFITYMALVLIIFFAPTAAYAERIIAERRGLEAAFSEFLRDVTELRKSGFTPEKIIETLAESRDYGPLSRYLKDISKQIRYGVPIRVVLTEFINTVKSYYARVFAWLLLESIDYGGASPETLESLATFSSTMLSINNDMLARLRPLRFVPYIGVMVLALTLVIMEYTVISLSSVLLHISQNLVNYVVNSFALTTIVDSFIMGLVAGKLGEGEVAAGFKHAVFITAISLAIYLASPLMAKMFSV